MTDGYWTGLLSDVLPGRVGKPRVGGLTMVIDTGWPTAMLRDLLQLASDHVDFWKFGFASASVCPPERVMDKVSLCQEYGVLAYPGGTSLEIATAQGVWKEYMESLWEHGIRAIEISDGTIELPLRLRREMIRHARRLGFTVLSEIGKKVPGLFLPVPEQAQIIHGDLNSGANYIIVEGREAGRGVGVYDSDGNVRDEAVVRLLDTLGPLSTRLLWEAPQVNQQLYYIEKLGNRVNLGNIRPFDVIALESLRRGFRSDTLRIGLGLPNPLLKNAVPEGSDVHVADPASDSSHQLDTHQNHAAGLTIWLDPSKHALKPPDAARPSDAPKPSDSSPRAGTSKPSDSSLRRKARE